MDERPEEFTIYDEEDAWAGSEEVKEELIVKRPLDKVVPIRLDAEMWEQLRIEARKKGIGPTTLARMWLIERLKYGPLQRPA